MDLQCSILSLLHPIHYTDAYLFKILSNVVLSYVLCHPRGLFPIRSPAKNLKALLLSSILAICSDLINVIKLTKPTRNRPIAEPSHRWEI